MKTTLRSMALWLLIAALCVVFGAAAAGQGHSPRKAVPSDEVNPKLETVLQELTYTAQTRPQAVSEWAQDRGIAVADDMVTVIVKLASGRASSIDRAAVAALGGVVEAMLKLGYVIRWNTKRINSVAWFGKPPEFLNYGGRCYRGTSDVLNVVRTR